MKLTFLRHSLLYLSIFLIAFFGCKKDEENPLSPSIINVKINGNVQKGPFVIGSTITIQEVNATSLSPNGTTFITTTSNDFGQFALDSKISTEYIEIISQGYYFNEVSGKISDAPLTLFGILKRTENIGSNVNLLTTLTKDRIKYLMLVDKKSYEDAKRQAEKEVLKVFGIKEELEIGFESMDISKNREADAVLIAISSILQTHNSVGELSELISKINLDLKEDGILSTGLLKILKENESRLGEADIRSNLSHRYSSLGMEITVPPYENYMDSDSDGIINKLDEDNADIFIKGVVQKGIFLAGTIVTIAEVRNPLDLRVTASFTTNDLGEFNGMCKVNYNYLELVAEGNYYDQSKGVTTNAPIKLEAFVQKDFDSMTVRLNVLTTLARKRIQYLINKEQKSFEEARLQAEKEVLKIFGIDEANLVHFNEMDISGNRVSDLILLAVSTIFSVDKNLYNAMDYLYAWRDDIEVDGLLDENNSYSAKFFSRKVDYFKVKANLINQYQAKGYNIEVGPFESYLDLDGDGIINKHDSETFHFVESVTAPWTYASACIAFDNKLWVLGKEVWSSSDGKTWVLENANPGWGDRIGFESVEINDKLWILGGKSRSSYEYNVNPFSSLNAVNWNLDGPAVPFFDGFMPIIFQGKVWIIGGQGSTSDIWNSSDMINWVKVSEPAPFGGRNRAGCVVFNNKIYVIGGYEWSGSSQKEIWYSSDGLTWQKSAKTIPWDSFINARATVFENKIVLSGPYGDIWISSDGENWQESTSNADQSLPGEAGYSTAHFDHKVWFIPYNDNGINHNIYYIYSYKP